MNIALLIVLVAVVAALAWNFYPPFREKVRGLSTILEASLGGILYYTGLLGDAYRDVLQQVDIPAQVEWWLTPSILVAWAIAKRLQTKTPVGKKL